MEFQWNYSKPKRMMPSRCWVHYVSKSGRPSSDHRTGKRSILIPIPKKHSTKECSNHRTVALISHTSKVMLKILHAGLQHYVNQELPDVQAGFRIERGTRDQIMNFNWITEKPRKLKKSIYLYFMDYAKVFDSVDHNKLRKALNERWEKPDHLTCLPRNLYVGQEATVQTRYGTTDLRSTGSRLRKEYVRLTERWQ